jgi:hypothetical protein
MSKLRRAAKADISQPQIVSDLRKAGFDVEILGLPVDLAVRRKNWPPSLFVMIEIKTPRKNGAITLDKRQVRQVEFCRVHGVQYICTSQEALEWITGIEKQFS